MAVLKKTSHTTVFPCWVPKLNSKDFKHKHLWGLYYMRINTHVTLTPYNHPDPEEHYTFCTKLLVNNSLVFKSCCLPPQHNVLLARNSALPFCSKKSNNFYVYIHKIHVSYLHFRPLSQQGLRYKIQKNKKSKTCQLL